MRFEGKCVVVTGAGSGIGRSIAERFRDEGAVVVAADLDPVGVPEGCIAIHTDVTRRDDVERLVAASLDATGRLDVWCNNAGIGSTTDVLACSDDEWDHVFDVNVRAVFIGTRAALPTMLRQGHGSIVNTASVAGMVGLRDRAAYCASKGAVIALTRQVAVQYAGTGVRCNCVCPGTVASPWVDRLLAGAADPVQRRAELVARQPLGRLAEPSEVAGAVLYLASDDAEFITGSALVIDGGLTAM